jgi:lipoprotein-anchoring transpeptidase ErfK/SrfK
MFQESRRLCSAEVTRSPPFICLIFQLTIDTKPSIKPVNSQFFRRCYAVWISVLIAIGIELLSSKLIWAQEPSFLLTQQPSIPDLKKLKQSGNRWIEIDLSKQRLIAWEGKRPVYAVIISTGKSSTPTPTGVFSIQTRHRTTRMSGENYDIPNVPYAMFYHRGYAIHGADWHNNFGTPVSHGCTNVAVNHARWIYNWASVGTPVIVRN